MVSGMLFQEGGNAFVYQLTKLAASSLSLSLLSQSYMYQKASIYHRCSRKHTLHWSGHGPDSAPERKQNWSSKEEGERVLFGLLREHLLWRSYVSAPWANQGRLIVNLTSHTVWDGKRWSSPSLCNQIDKAVTTWAWWPRLLWKLPFPPSRKASPISSTQEIIYGQCWWFSAQKEFWNWELKGWIMEPCLTLTIECSKSFC